MSDKTQESWVAFGKVADTYGKQYGDLDFSEKYPANKPRLNIALDLLKKCNPKTVLDVGCGTGDPLTAILDAGYSAQGFDFADEMVAKAKENLESKGYNSDLVGKNNMTEPKGLAPESFDAVVALGSLYYAREFEKTMDAITNLIVPGGDLIFSLRNQLFALFSMNKYTAEFFAEQLVDCNSLDGKMKRMFEDDLCKVYEVNDVQKLVQSVDDQKIYSRQHNPLTVAEEVLAPVGLELEGIYYYHFHAMPPKFEHVVPQKFRELSWAMENPTDWRGTFMASTFVVHAKKKP